MLGSLSKTGKSGHSVLYRLMGDSGEAKLQRARDRLEAQRLRVAKMEEKHVQKAAKMGEKARREEELRQREAQLLEREARVRNSEAERNHYFQQLQEQFNTEVEQRVDDILIQKGLRPNVIRNANAEEPVVREFQQAAGSDEDQEEQKDQVHDNEQSMDGIVLNNALNTLRLQTSGSSIKTRSQRKALNKGKTAAQGH